jgi:protein-disulfide isomerase
MAKNKKHELPKASSQNITETQDDEAITINLQSYAVPLSILIGAIIISLSIFFSIKGQSLFSTSAEVAGVGTNPTTAVDETVENTTATTNINGVPYLGNKDSAKVAIVEFSDVECPYCIRHHEQVYPDVIKNLVDSGKAIYAYRAYIAVPSHNPAATNETYAAFCVNELTGNNNAKFFEYLNLLYGNSQGNGLGLTGNQMYDLAGGIGIDTNQLKTCVDSAKFKDKLTQDEQEAQKAGIQGTPGFVVGKLSSDGTVTGEIIAGAYPYTQFETVVNKMLE